VPEYATPLEILTAMAAIFSGGNKTRPHVVAAVSDAESGKGYLLNGGEVATDRFTEIVKEGTKEMELLLKSQSRSESSGALFIGDKNLIVTPSPGGQRFLSNEMMFVRIPADTSTLNMLVVVEGQIEFPLPKKEMEVFSLQTRVGQIVDRISVLQQVGKSVLDVVEIEIQDESNYPLRKRADNLTSGGFDAQEKMKTGRGKMPDLEGLSLRKSLQLLQEHNLKIRLRGTGRVVSQKPLPGALLQGISECILTLEKVEDMKFEKMIDAGPDNNGLSAEKN